MGRDGERTIDFHAVSSVINQSDSHGPIYVEANQEAEAHAELLEPPAETAREDMPGMQRCDE